MNLFKRIFKKSQIEENEIDNFISSDELNQQKEFNEENTTSIFIEQREKFEVPPEKKDEILQSLVRISLL